MRKGYILTELQAAEIFLILSQSRIKLNGKIQTSSQKWFDIFEESLGLKPQHNLEEKGKNEGKEKIE